MEAPTGRIAIATRLNRSRSRESSNHSFTADLSKSLITQPLPTSHSNRNSNTDVLIDSSFLQDVPPQETGKRLKNNILGIRFKSEVDPAQEVPRRTQTKKRNPLNQSFSDKSFEMPNEDARSVSRQEKPGEYSNNQRREADLILSRKEERLNELAAKTREFDESFTMPVHPVDQMVHKVSNLGELKSRPHTPLRHEFRQERQSIDRRNSVVSDVGSVSSFQRPLHDLNDSVYSGSSSKVIISIGSIGVQRPQAQNIPIVHHNNSDVGYPRFQVADRFGSTTYHQTNIRPNLHDSFESHADPIPAPQPTTKRYIQESVSRTSTPDTVRQATQVKAQTHHIVNESLMDSLDETIRDRNSVPKPSPEKEKRRKRAEMDEPEAVFQHTGARDRKTLLLDESILSERNNTSVLANLEQKGNLELLFDIVMAYLSNVSQSFRRVLIDTGASIDLQRDLLETRRRINDSGDDIQRGIQIDREIRKLDRHNLFVFMLGCLIMLLTLVLIFK
jgi:hypothetical protein